MNRLLEIKEELRQLRASIATAKDEELDGIQEKISALETEKQTVEKRAKMQADAQRALMLEQGAEEVEERSETKVLGSQGEDARAVEIQKRTQMGKDLKINKRTVILDATVVIPQHKSNTIQEFPFNQVSSILDAVNYLPVITGESYEEPYVTETGTADYTAQASASGTDGKYHGVGIGWSSAKINKTKLTAYSEITKELDRTPAINYAAIVEGNISLSLKKKLAKEIVIGNGATGHFVGFASSAVKADAVTDYNLGVIGENTLDELILNYGGEEDVESKMSIILNKLTLLEFSKVRGANKNKVYTIDYTNNTIDGVKFFTTSSLKSFAAAATGDVFMVYGDINKYRVAIFSNIETARSEDFKFDQGIVAFRGDVFMGGNIIGYKAFSRIFKAASSVTAMTVKTATTQS